MFNLTNISGKTYTTLGPATSPDFFTNQKHTPEHDAVGIVPRALRDLFRDLEQKRNSYNVNPASSSEEDDILDEAIHLSKSPISKRQSSSSSTNNTQFEYQVKLQFLELYGEEIRDLLSTSSTTTQQKIVIRDSAGDSEAIGATEVPVASAQEAMVCLTRGMLRRVTGATAMNPESSRSHAIMCVMIEQITRTNGEEGEAVVVQKSKFNFVDLAGCERAKRTHAKGQRLKEGININKGLLVLGNVISALGSGDKTKFVPFRDSKLTRLLRGSLGGNHKTREFCCEIDMSTFYQVVLTPCPSILSHSYDCLCITITQECRRESQLSPLRKSCKANPKYGHSERRSSLQIGQCTPESSGGIGW